MTIGRRLKLARILTHQSLPHIAACAHLTPQALSDIENDQGRLPDGAIIYDIATALGIELSVLFNLTSLTDCSDRKQARALLRPYIRRLSRERGARLQTRREELNLSKQEVATAIGKSAAFVSDAEVGRTLALPSDILPAYAEALECSPEWILGNKRIVNI